MADLTADQVLALAPDSASVGPGRELSNPAKWASAGRDGGAVWGEAKGSGANPYQVAVDLRELAFKCSCPSRKIPCKHTLGLLLRLANGNVEVGKPPAWVTEWLDKRQAKAVAKAEPKEERAPDPEAQAKRAEKRWENVLAGIDECRAFLGDVAGQGFLASQSARSWREMAARMVDAQAPGVAKRIAAIDGMIGVGPAWADRASREVGRLALLLEAARRLEALPPDLQQDVRAELGIPVRKEDLEGAAVEDVWDLVGQSVSVEDKLTTRQTWMLGRTTRRWATHLAFEVVGRPPDKPLMAGTAARGALVFYPSAWPSRVHLEAYASQPFAAEAGDAWADAGARLADALAALPWTRSVPVALAEATFSHSDGTWGLRDREGLSVPLGDLPPSRFLALSGGEPFSAFGTFDGVRMRLLSAWHPSWGFVSA